MKPTLFFSIIALFMQPTHLCSQTAATTTSVLGEPRMWQREAGSAFTAALRGLEGGKVILQSADGRTATLELSALSRNDRDYVRGKMGALAQRWLGQNATPSSKPAPDRSGWPTIVRVPQESLRMSVKRSFEAGKGMKFASMHFEFESPVDIAAAEQRSIATPFELIHEVWRLAPWGVITPPKDGGLFQVELFLHTTAYEAVGAPPNSGCHFDQRAKKLRVLGSAIGLESERTPLWRDEHSSIPALAYGMVPLLTQGVIALVPEYLIPGLALTMRKLPVLGDSAWPEELLSTLSETTTPLAKIEVSAFFYATSKSTVYPPLEPAKIQRIIGYFIAGDGSHGRNLGDFLSAAAADRPLWDEFNQRIAERDNAIIRNKADPAVVIPMMPSVPNDLKTAASLRTFHLPKLLRSPDVPSGIGKIQTSLNASP